MNNSTPTTQTFLPPEGGFTKTQQAEYDALKISNEEYVENFTTQGRLEKINACALHGSEQLALIWGERYSDESDIDYLERLVVSMESKLKSMTRKDYHIPANHAAAQFLTAALEIVRSHPVYAAKLLGKS